MKEKIFGKKTYEDSQISLRGSADHVGNKGLVAGRIQDGEVLLLRLEEGSAHLHCLALLSLLIIRVHAPRQVPASVGYDERKNSNMVDLRKVYASLVL